MFLSKGLLLAVAASLTYMLLKLVDMMVDLWKTRPAMSGDAKNKPYNDLLFPVISKSLKVFIVVISILVTSQNLGFNITALLTGMSITGLALGLAAQDTVANLFGAVAVFIDKPFQIGDHIRLGEVDGVVETMGLRSTRVRSGDGHLITVPNKTMGNATITNVTRRPRIKTELNIPLAYELPAAKVKEAIEILYDVFSKHPMTDDVVVNFNRFSEAGLNLQVVHFWKALDHKPYVAGLAQLNLQVKERFERAGIQFASNRSLYLKGNVADSAQTAKDSRGINAGS